MSLSLQWISYPSEELTRKWGERQIAGPSVRIATAPMTPIMAAYAPKGDVRYTTYSRLICILHVLRFISCLKRVKFEAKVVAI
jgi:hypothetical protein